MTTKQLLGTACFLAAMTASSSLMAQVKVGSNPTTINPNSNLEVEATNGKKVIVHKDNGTVVIENVPTGAATDSVMTVDANGNVRRRSIEAFRSTIQVNPYIKTRGIIVAFSQDANNVSWITNQNVLLRNDITYSAGSGEMIIVNPGIYYFSSMSTSPNQFPNPSDHCSYIYVNGVREQQICSRSHNGAGVAVANTGILALKVGDKVRVGLSTASTAASYGTYEYVVSLYKLSEKVN